MEKKKGSNHKPHAQSLVALDSRTLQEQGRGSILSDVLGSYTGTPEDGERPEQDADDL